LEIETAQMRNKGMALSLAARFAAKEAFGKALGTGLAHFALIEVAVINDSRGRPPFASKATRAASSSAMAAAPSTFR